MHKQHSLLDAFHGRGLGLNGNADGFAHHGACQGLHLGVHGGGEKERLAFGRQLGADAFDVGDESHVEHAINFIEHEHLHVLQLNVALVHQVQQAAGSGHQHVHTAMHGLHLAILIHSAEYHRVGEVQETAVGLEAITNLRG